jgi:hypothetical protein
MSVISTIDELEAMDGQPAKQSIVKETDCITPRYRALIEASPLASLGDQRT